MRRSLFWKRLFVRCVQSRSRFAFHARGTQSGQAVFPARDDAADTAAATAKRSLVHFLRFYVELLQEIGETAHGEDAGQRATDPRSKDITVNETGCDPGAETEWTGEQFPDSAAQSPALGAFFHFTRAAFPFYFGERRAKRARHFVLGNDTAQFLGGESKQDKVYRFDPFG